MTLVLPYPLLLIVLLTSCNLRSVINAIVTAVTSQTKYIYSSDKAVDTDLQNLQMRARKAMKRRAKTRKTKARYRPHAPNVNVAWTSAIISKADLDDFSEMDIVGVPVFKCNPSIQRDLWTFVK